MESKDSTKSKNSVPVDTEMEEEIKQTEVVDDAGIEYTETQDLQEISSETDEFLAQIEIKLSSEYWKEQFYAIDDLRRLYKYKQDGFDLNLARFAHQIIQGVENLRSSICRNSLNLVVEVFSSHKKLDQIEANGEATPYLQFCKNLLPVVGIKVADDKVFLSSRAKTALELITKHWFNKDLTETLWDLSRSKSIIIATEASKALKENCNSCPAEFLENEENVNRLLKTLSEDLVAKRQPFSKNAQLILKNFKEKIGEESLRNIAKEVLQEDEEVQKLMQVFSVKKEKDESKGFREFLKKKKSTKQKDGESAEEVFIK